MTDFDQLVEMHYQAVYKTCLAQFKNSDLAMEITQEAFSRAFVKFGNLRNSDKFRSWVTSIALRHGYLKSRQDLSRYNALPPDDQLERDGYSIIADDMQIEESNFVRHWILTLREPDQNIILMKHYYLMTNEEIARETGKAVSTIKRRLSLLKSSLKAAVQEEMLIT